VTLVDALASLLNARSTAFPQPRTDRRRGVDDQVGGGWNGASILRSAAMPSASFCCPAAGGCDDLFVSAHSMSSSLHEHHARD